MTEKQVNSKLIKKFLIEGEATNSIPGLIFLALAFAINYYFFNNNIYAGYIIIGLFAILFIQFLREVIIALSKKFSEAEKRNYVIDVINKRKLELQQLESLEKHLKEKQEIEEKIHKLDAQKKALRSEMNDLDADKKNLISKANELKTT